MLAFVLLILLFSLYKRNLLKSKLYVNIFIILATLITTAFVIDIAIYLLNINFMSHLVDGSRFSYTGDNHRYAIWIQAIKLWSNNMLTGVGTGVKFNHVPGAHHVLGFHNTFLNILTSGGIIGFILYLYLILLFVKKISDNTILSEYKMLQLVVFISLSYNATLFFVIYFS